jgi:hypothetical protein
MAYLSDGVPVRRALEATRKLGQRPNRQPNLSWGQRPCSEGEDMPQAWIITRSSVPGAAPATSCTAASLDIGITIGRRNNCQDLWMKIF